MEKQRVLSGMRPTGRIHLGNLHGALLNWVSLQEEYNCFYFVADWHALTSEYKAPHDIQDNIYEMMVDWLAVGLDPEKSVLFVQSQIKEHAELFLLFSMIIPLSWLERNPTYKEMLVELKGREVSTYGFFGYPVLQGADILIYKASKVPVGADQVPHLELTREIARRFNFLYGNVFPEPEPILTPTPKIPGIDGRKMSKSYNNAIFLSDTVEETRKKFMRMFTDPRRLRRYDPGNPGICPVFSYHRLYSSQGSIDEIDRECRRAGIGCVDCKRRLIENINESLMPIREKRQAIKGRKKWIEGVMADGNIKARKVARMNIEEVREAMGLMP